MISFGKPNPRQPIGCVIQVVGRNWRLGKSVFKLKNFHRFAIAQHPCSELRTRERDDVECASTMGRYAMDGSRFPATSLRTKIIGLKKNSQVDFVNQIKCTSTWAGTLLFITGVYASLQTTIGRVRSFVRSFVRSCVSIINFD